MTCRSVLLLLLVVIGTAKSAAGYSRSADSIGRAFEVSDYFEIARIDELALSGPGDRLAYAVEIASLAEDRVDRQTYLTSLPVSGEPVSVQALVDAHALAWIGGTSELAFLSSRDGAAQVFSYDTQTGSVRKVTGSEHPVLKFRYAPSGERLAYTTKRSSDPSPSLLDRMRDADHGIVIDTSRTSLYDFVNPNWNPVSQESNVLWIDGTGVPRTRIEVPGEVTEFHWSADGKRLSVTYVDDGSTSLLRHLVTSIGVVEVSTRTLLPLAQGRPAADGASGRGYLGGEWLSDSKRLMIRRLTLTDPWVSGAFQEWAVTSGSRPLSDSDLSWRPVEVYPGRANFIPLSDSMVIAENTVEGTHSLFVLKADGVRRSNLLAGLDGSSSHFVWNANRQRAAFVHESLTSPPEIYVIDAGREPYRITGLNDLVSRKRIVDARDLTWKSSDGTLVSGWLLEPAEQVRSRPLPLIVFVHGGPCYAFTDAYASYFHLWPYPFEVYVSHGMAVFIPNYRGTCGFGRDFNSPSSIDREPVDDIISGVRFLIESGKADAKRIGISGHSHGAWLGPTVMTRTRLFRAGSFAEGTSNYILTYELMPGLLNREVHDVVNGGSLYEDPARYIELSPDLHFKGIATASLFESGALSGSLLMFGMAKAARHYGLPVENVVYPATGHNIQSPRFRRESAQRNLDWFRFWLQDEEDADAAKAGQYARWRAMRDVSRSGGAISVSASPCVSSD